MSEVVCFTVPGKPVGYQTMTRGGRFSAKATKYHAWMERVKTLALSAGWRQPEATFERPVYVETTAFYADKRGPDPENVRKGIVDALFPSRRGAGDKYVWGRHGRWEIDARRPRVEVLITWEEA